MADKPLRVAIIGCGHHATWTLYPCLQFFDYSRIDPVGVCDLDIDKAQQTARRFGLGKAFTDYSVMTDELHPDAVIACVSPVIHENIIVQMIQRNIPLLIEKPPARSSKILIELADQAEKQQAKVMVAFMRRFGSLTKWATQAMSEDSFGRIMMLHGREGIWGCPPDHMVMDSGIHILDLMRHLAGPNDEVQSVYAAANSDNNVRTGVAVILRFTSGLIANVTLSSLESFTYPNNVVEIHDDQGSLIRIDNWTRGTWHRDAGTFCSPPIDVKQSSLSYEQPWNAANINRASAMQGYVAELDAFFSYVENNEMPSPNLRDGIKALQMVEAIEQSILQRKEIEVLG